MHISISDITQDPSFSSADKQKLGTFRTFVEKYFDTQTPPGSNWKNLSLFQLCESSGIDLSSLAKEGAMLCALWVIILRGIKNYITDEQFKYPTMNDFLEHFQEFFPHDEESELQNLWKTANWMHILFEMMPAKKNKGLAMLVVPRFVESWTVKYVTGSGQTHFTANRVKVFEIEGETKASHRGKLKLKPKKKSSPSTPRRQSSSEEQAGVGTALHGDDSDTNHSSIHLAPPVARKRKNSSTNVHRDSSGETTSDTGFVSDMHAINNNNSNDINEDHNGHHPRRQKRSRMITGTNPLISGKIPAPPIPGRCTTDVLVSADAEIRDTYREFQLGTLQRDETGLLLLPDLQRSDSLNLWGVVNLGNNNNNNPSTNLSNLNPPSLSAISSTAAIIGSMERNTSDLSFSTMLSMANSMNTPHTTNNHINHTNHYGTTTASMPSTSLSNLSLLSASNNWINPHHHLGLKPDDYDVSSLIGSPPAAPSSTAAPIYHLQSYQQQHSQQQISSSSNNVYGEENIQEVFGAFMYGNNNNNMMMTGGNNIANTSAMNTTCPPQTAIYTSNNIPFQ